MNYNEIRKKTKKIKAGDLYIGGDAPITVQSMTNTDTLDAAKTTAQIKALVERGCDIVRIAAPTVEAAATFAYAKREGVTVPLVADIHFDYKIALECVKAGVDKIRINPGNIGSDDKVREVCRACADAGIPIRVGVNSGSLEKSVLAKYGAPTPEALVESALYHVGLLEKFGFYDTVISIKTTNAHDMIKANRLLSERTSYPIHIGVTEAGTPERGLVRSAVGVGSLLCDGIGDTLRVSLTGDPLLEVDAAKKILEAVGVDGKHGMNVISCPTCGRTKIDLPKLVADFEKAAKDAGVYDLPINVALMGCVVNGPGEAKEADIGIAGGVGEAVIIESGEITAKVAEDKVINALIARIKEKYKDKLGK